MDAYFLCTYCIQFSEFFRHLWSGFLNILGFLADNDQDNLVIIVQDEPKKYKILENTTRRCDNWQEKMVRKIFMHQCTKN